MSYATLIRGLAPGYDPRHVEAYMRVEHNTLDKLSPRDFAREVRLAVACIDEGGIETAELVAKSFGF
jgi:hypothetical protein